jgi:hypothetical protein
MELTAVMQNNSQRLILASRRLASILIELSETSRPAGVTYVRPARRAGRTCVGGAHPFNKHVRLRTCWLLPS